MYFCDINEYCNDDGIFVCFLTIWTNKLGQCVPLTSSPFYMAECANANPPQSQSCGTLKPVTPTPMLNTAQVLDCNAYRANVRFV